ncbi:STY4526/YPO1902 family pathogenicity island replication protein, partial [Halomonas sp. THAF12]|uniref:STY4526/YPO1902 family pathogenicity island replication protein n=1 Tax=Halomonas sp. B23F22_10 TaxID=3459515 RepID=UPI00373EE323
EAKIDRCLELGASVQMMTRFFALTGNDCSTRRALLGLESRQGRLAMPADDVEHDAYRRWQNITRDPDDSSCIDDLDGMIALAEETDLSLGVVWHLVNEWAQTAEKQAKAAASRSSRSRFGERACAG